MQKESIITILSSVLLSVIVSTTLAKQTPATIAPVAPVAQPQAAAEVPSNLDASIENFLKSNPTIIRETLELAAQKEREEEEKRIAESYKQNIDELHNIKNSPYIGPKDAKITIVEFFDFNCGYCKRVAPAMMQIIKKNPDVRVILKPVAFLRDTSATAAKALLATAEEGKFVEFYESLLTQNGQITETVIFEHIEKAGLDVAKIKKLMESDKVKKNFEEIAELSRTVQVRGVPTLIINGSPLRAIDEAPIQDAINNLR